MFIPNNIPASTKIINKYISRLQTNVQDMCSHYNESRDIERRNQYEVIFDNVVLSDFNGDRWVSHTTTVILDELGKPTDKCKCIIPTPRGLSEFENSYILTLWDFKNKS